jgi:hypothetical protein
MPNPKKTTKYRAVKIPTVMRSFGSSERSAEGEGLDGPEPAAAEAVAGVLGSADMGGATLLRIEVR